MRSGSRTFFSWALLPLRQRRSVTHKTVLLVLGMLSISCSQPYDLKVSSYVDSPKELAEAIKIVPDQMIGRTAFVTKSELNLKFQKKFAREMIISKTSACAGEWETFVEEKNLPWEGRNGPNQVFVKFRNFSKEESICFSHGFSFDTLPPELKFKKMPGVISPYRAPSFELEVLEDGSAVASIEYSIDKGPWQKGDFSFDVAQLANGDHQIDIRANDTVGHESTVLSHKWKIDENTPLLVFTQKPRYYSNVTTARFEFIPTENPMTKLTAERFTCQLNTGPVSPCQSPVDLSGLGNGLQTLQVNAYDKAGNLSVFREQWIVDTIKPTVRIVDRPLALSNLRSASFTLDGTDTNGSGIGRYECRIDSRNFEVCAAAGKTFTGLAEGDHTFDVRSVDRSGNVSDVASYRWTIDSIGPRLTILTAPEPYVRGPNVQFTYSVEVAGAAALNQIQCRKLATETYQNCQPPSKSFNNLAEGDYEFSLRATDRAGNATVVNRNFKIDRTLPVITVTEQPMPLSTRATATFRYTLTDVSGFSSVACSLDNAAFASCGNTVKSYYNLVDGRHVFKLQVTDRATNVRTVTIQWDIDRTRPTLAFTTPPPGPTLTVGQNATFQYSATDLSGVQTVACFVNNQPVTSRCYRNSFQMVNLAKGSYSIRISATDKFGNVGNITHSFRVP